MLTILCIATYFKGEAYLRECRRQGCTVLLLTVDTLADAAWPRDAIDEIYTIPRDASGAEIRRRVERSRARTGSTASSRSTTSTSRRRRCCASTSGCPAWARPRARLPRQAGDARQGRAIRACSCPSSSHGHQRPGAAGSPKACRRRGCSSRDRTPRPSASRRSRTATSCGARSTRLGDERSFYVLEQFVPGDVFHVDSLVWNGARRLRRGAPVRPPPFRSRTRAASSSRDRLPRRSDDGRSLLEANRAAAATLGLVRGVVAHRVHPSADDGACVFPRDVRPRRRRLHRRHRRGGHRDQPLARVGEDRDRRRGRRLCGAGASPRLRRHRAVAGAAGGAGHCPRTTTRRSSTTIRKHHHAGVIVSSPDPQRIDALIDDYTQRFYRDFFATAPPPERPVE